MNNPTVKTAMKVATIAGASVLVLNSAMSLMKVSSPKEAIMPLVSILVGVAAFNYALQSTSSQMVTVNRK
jgi:hypothetical protein|tara:strand:+ start:795 stop:1004 length:210 start_codon:yes stop_codon:yes gene_type:complete